MKIIMSRKGFILPLTMVVFMVLMLFSVSILYLVDTQGVSSGIISAPDDEIKTGLIPSEKALQYAEAGYSAYLWKLNDYVTYYLTEESQNMMNTPIEHGNGYYQLDVTWPSDTERYVTITSTGWSKDSPDVKRTIEVQLQKKQFVHHVYVSQSEIMPPNIVVSFGGSDKLYGPVHTNGTLRTTGTPGPEFFNTVSYVVSIIQNGSPVYHRGDPQKVQELEMQETNAELKDWAELDDAIFYGRTSIHLEDDKLRIKYPDFGVDNPTGTEDLLGYTEEVIDIPSNGVIYIDGSDQVEKWHPHTGNLFIAGTLSGELTIAAKNNIYITHSDPTEFYDDHDWNPGGDYYDNESEEPPSPPPFPEDGGIFYKNTEFELEENGDVTIAGEAKDMLGLVANNNVYVLHYGWPRDGSDGEGHFWDYGWEKRTTGWIWPTFRNWRRTSRNSERYDVAPTNIHIHAALFALNEGFGFEYYNTGSEKGDIIIWGNITQALRYAVRMPAHWSGPPWVWNPTTGYGKQYAHDPRMFYHYPPHILEPVNAGWEVRDWKEI